MIYLVIGLIVLGLFAAALGWLHERRVQKKIARGEEVELPSVVQVRDMECCGQHEVCEKESLLAALEKEIVYYDDEELDAYAGRRGDDYTEAETEQFREVLFTMQEQDVAGWVRSLQLRGITLPDGVKDDVLLVVGELRQSVAN